MNNFIVGAPYPGDQYLADVLTTRIDHKISENNSLYGRVSAYLPRYVLAGNYPALGTDQAAPEPLLVDSGYARVHAAHGQYVHLRR